MFVLLFSSCLLLCPTSAAAGEQEVTARSGDDVTLQSRCPGDAVVSLLEWVRLEQKSNGYVFFYRNERSYANYQHPSFRGRVALTDPEMTGGDVSVTMRNVSAGDAGVYTCRVVRSTIEHDEETSTEFRDRVRLVVTDSESWSRQVSGLEAPLALAVGNPDGGNKDGGNEDGGNEDGGQRNPPAGVVAGVTVPTLFIIFSGIAFKYMSSHKSTKRLPPPGVPDETASQLV